MRRRQSKYKKEQTHVRGSAPHVLQTRKTARAPPQKVKRKDSKRFVVKCNIFRFYIDLYVRICQRITFLPFKNMERLLWNNIFPLSKTYG